MSVVKTGKGRGEGESSAKALSCWGCGLTLPQEPSVQVRRDGRVFCNDCWRNPPDLGEPERCQRTAPLDVPYDTRACTLPLGHTGLCSWLRHDEPVQAPPEPTQAVADRRRWVAERSGLYDLGAKIVERARWRPASRDERDGPENLYTVAYEQMIIAFGRGWAGAEDEARNRPETESPEPRIQALEDLASAVRRRCREAVPEWAPDLREILARLDARGEKGTER